MSRLGTLRRPKSFHPLASVAAHTHANRACTSSRRGESHKPPWQVHGSIGSRRWAPKGLRAESVEDVFIQSLVAAGTCGGCSTAPSSATRHEGRIIVPANVCQSMHAAAKRAFSTHARTSQAETARQAEQEPEISRKQYADLVDTYDSLTLRERHPRRSKDHYRLAPRLVVTPEQEDRPPHGKRQILDPIDEWHREKLGRLMYLLGNGPGYFTRKKWQAYLDLPTPRLRYISDADVHKLFQHFAWVEIRNLESSQRYFSLLEDALGEHVPLGAGVWNTAITFAGRWVRKTTSDEVKAAIETWLRMEKEGGVPASNTTFNILFHVAVKAGRFALADTIYAEMDRRGLELNRYFRSSKIYYAGRKGDGENVRAAFREAVAAGEIVDTAIMNCVVLSLVRCGETASAEHVVGKMKNLHDQKFGTATPKDWRDKKAVGRRLDRDARRLRKNRNKHLASFFGSPYSDDDKKEKIQRAAPIAPDELTYRILIQWHARVSGNLGKICAYLKEIKEGGWNLQHSTYLHLFAGFYRHGGYAFTDWNRKGLEGYWKEYMDAVASNVAAAPAQGDQEPVPLEKPPADQPPTDQPPTLQSSVPGSQISHSIEPMDSSDTSHPSLETLSFSAPTTSQQSSDASPTNNNPPSETSPQNFRPIEAMDPSDPAHPSFDALNFSPSTSATDDYHRFPNRRVLFSHRLSAADDNEEQHGEDTDPPPSHLAPIEFHASTIIYALLAFYKCAGVKRMLQVWDEVQRNWRDMDEVKRRRFEGLVAEKVREGWVYKDI